VLSGAFSLVPCDVCTRDTSNDDEREYVSVVAACCGCVYIFHDKYVSQYSYRDTESKLEVMPC
jgi:hypothetical protein